MSKNSLYDFFYKSGSSDHVETEKSLKKKKVKTTTFSTKEELKSELDRLLLDSRTNHQVTE